MVKMISRILRWFQFLREADQLFVSLMGSLIFVSVSFLFSAFSPPDGFKHELQFLLINVPYFWIVLAFSISKRHVNRFLFFLQSVKGFSLLWLLSFCWLLLMLVVHGDARSNLEGVNSGLAGLGALPLAAYIGFYYSRFTSFKYGRYLAKILFFSITLLVLSENIFLIIHHFAGLSASLTYHTTQHLVRYPGLLWDFYPRIALNTREGNLLSLAGVIVIYSFLISDRVKLNIDKCRIQVDRQYWVSQYNIQALLSLCFFNALISQGRALLMSILIPVLMHWVVTRLQAIPSRQQEVNHIARLFGICFLLAWFFYQAIQIIVPIDVTMLGRSVSDLESLSLGGLSGRALIWKQWLLQGFLPSPWLGSGFNFHPIYPGVHPNLSSAHNLLIQILSDSGLLGLSIAAGWFSVVFAFIRPRFMALGLGPFSVVITFFIFASLGSVVVRPIGIVLLVIFVACLFASFPDIVKFPAASSPGSIALYKWMRPSLFRFVLVSFFCLAGCFFFALKI